ncbi:MAG TPA: alpha/beta fold hydrolase [Terracidiphilus sp.]|jgi:pimeloyl-ACP methyl ester carboxylesterase|nr:alpha/beta fold hydrolase [Terracidiphilus sp.]
MPPSPGNRQTNKARAAEARNAETRSVEARNTQAQITGVPPTVSARWLAAAVLAAALGAAVCVWIAFCIVFWQGSWQLLYHPAAAIAHTPASRGLAFDDVAFATTEDGIPQLKGWWISAGPTARITAIYLHGADGNIGDTVESLAQLHAANVNVLAFDYHGYGQSLAAHPSEARWKQDAESALHYLIGTRHIAAGSIVLAGSGLGGNLALEIAATYPELAGVILDEPLAAPADAIFRDPRAKLVPAHLLVEDRWDTTAPATDLRIPSLWFYRDTTAERNTANLTAAHVSSSKMVVWLPPIGGATDQANALSRWLDSLPIR